ncbi:hypothetical protein [Streptomyces indicus]|uniref:Uncharacterized protein n=1 Tax=Streptomyces indicus TaxID=417292 RepID=A0A1G9GNZ3_9ACTN|nr:hypothetical protein [Streptomyces indicus]SDL02358.1 hypothetical protein SAMN05421806_116116 [Streptomyces indicus]
MTNSSGRPRRRPGPKIIAPALAVVIAAVGAHLWLNTNLFAKDSVCGGMVPTASADAVFTASGRVTDGVALDASSSDRLDFTCTVDSSSFLPGSETESLRISADRERGDVAFMEGRWPSPARMSYFADGATGAVGADHGWVLLPEACTTQDGPAIVEAYAPEGSDPKKVARLLTEVANKAAQQADCASGKALTAPDSLVAAPKPQPVTGDEICGLQGLRFPGQKGQSKISEWIQDRSEHTWSCEVEEHAVFSVTQEPHLIAAMQASPAYEPQPQVAGHKVSGFDSQHVVADCSGTPTYFSMEIGQKYHDAMGQPGTPRSNAMFENFVDVAGQRFGCASR